MNKRSFTARQIKSKTFLPCQRQRCAATCAAHEHTELAAIPSWRESTRRHRHERPDANHSVRLRGARRDWRGGQAGEEVPHMLARCAACVAAGMAQGRTRAGMNIRLPREKNAYKSRPLAGNDYNSPETITSA